MPSTLVSASAVQVQPVSLVLFFWAPCRPSGTLGVTEPLAPSAVWVEEPWMTVGPWPRPCLRNGTLAWLMLWSPSRKILQICLTPVTITVPGKGLFVKNEAGQTLATGPQTSLSPSAMENRLHSLCHTDTTEIFTRLLACERSFPLRREEGRSMCEVPTTCHTARGV